MEKGPRRFKARSDSDLVHSIKAAIMDGVPLVVDTDHESYPLYPDAGGVTVGPRSRRMKDRLLALAGAWGDLDADEMIRRIYEARQEAPPSDPVKP